MSPVPILNVRHHPHKDLILKDQDQDDDGFEQYDQSVRQDVVVCKLLKAVQDPPR